MAQRGPIGWLWAMAWIVFRWGGWPALVLFLYAFDPGGWFGDKPADSPTPEASVSATPKLESTVIASYVPTGPFGKVLEVSTPGVLHIDFNWNGRFDGDGEAVSLAACNVKDAFVASPADGSWQAKALADLRKRYTGKLVAVEWSGTAAYVIAPDGEVVNMRVLGSGYAWHAEDSGKRAESLKSHAMGAITAKKGLHAQ